MKNINIEKIQEMVGKELGASNWMEIDQNRINSFAECTGDYQYIHLDEEKTRAEASFGGTIAHGFLSLSLLSKFANESSFEFSNKKIIINYGFNKIRFINPVRAGKKIRAKFILLEVSQRKNSQMLIKFEVTIEIEGEDKPAVFAEWLTLLV